MFKTDRKMILEKYIILFIFITKKYFIAEAQSNITSVSQFNIEHYVTESIKRV